MSLRPAIFISAAFAQRAAEGALKVLGSEHPDTKKYQELQRRLQTGVGAAK
jgi:hypothetical protein